MTHQVADWIAADWGTSNLRLWAMTQEGRVLDTRSSDQGMGRLAREDFEPALLALCGDLLDPARVTPVVVCGMAGARQGWAEAPYLAVPTDLADLGVGGIRPPLTATHIDVIILPGLSQDAPADVMRGEETQITGFCAETPGFDGTLCLPGTHNKWVRLADNRVESFRTAMTGELFALLTSASVLRHSTQSDDDDPEAFDAGVRAALDAPEDLTTGLFALRAESLLFERSGATGKSRLSGLLIGQELAGARAYWQDHPVAVIGAGSLAARYVRAITLAGGQAHQADGAGLALAGLTAAHARLFKEPS